MVSTVVDGLPYTEEKKKYILDTLDPILEEMVSDLLLECPKSPLDFMTTWLRRRNGSSVASRMSMRMQNQALKAELNAMKDFMTEAGGCIEHEELQKEDEEEEDDDDDCGDELPEAFRKSEASMGKTRASVSAEAYGQWNQKKEFTPPVHEKSNEQKLRLSATLQKSFLFADLEAKDMETVLMAMVEMKFNKDQKVITEGENGDFLFVIEKGSLDCIKAFNGTNTVVKSVGEGDVFGELALLYNCPRAASVMAKEECVCWQLDRETFNYIVKDAAVKRRNKYDNFLQSVSLLASVDAYERSQIADALKPEFFKKGDVVIKQDEPGSKFYIVEDGNLFAEKVASDNKKAKVMDYKAGDYFGELALLKNQPRAATVIVESDTAKVLSLTRVSFMKMLGPLQSLMTRSAAYK